MNDDEFRPFEATALLRTVVGMLASDYPSRMQMESLLHRLGLGSGAVQITCVQGLLNLLRALPLYVFSSDDDRLAMISAMREVLDAAIDEEESASLDGGEQYLPAAWPPHPSTLQ